MNREERKNDAKRIIKLIKKDKNMSEFVRKSLKSIKYVGESSNMESSYNGKIYPILEIKKPTKVKKLGKSKMKVEVFEGTSIDPLFSKNEQKDLSGKNIGILDFASYKNPGGGFLKGSISQEEFLCHHSTLYLLLNNLSHYYKIRKSKKGKYGDDMFYIRDVLFFKDNSDNKLLSKSEKNENFRCADVITCSAPNKKVMLKNGYSEKNVKKTMEKRIKNIFKCAVQESINVLILGAFGCGVFGNDPYETASLFETYVNKYGEYFDKIIFAIPKGKELKAFKEVFMQK